MTKQPKSPYPQLPVAFKRKWLKALRSGKYEQGMTRLHWENKWCCLGVVCDIQKVTNIKRHGLISKTSGLKGLSRIPNILKVGKDENSFDNPVVHELVTMNDSGKTFNEIANWIEKNL